MLELRKATDVIEKYINEELEKNESAQARLKNKDSKRRAKNNCFNTVQLLDSLYSACEIEENFININPRENVGVLVEVVAKSLLNRGYEKAQANQYDIVLANGVAFEIKTAVAGSSRLSSAINFEATEDMLIISNRGAFMLRRKNWEHAKEQGFINKENRLKASIFKYDRLEKTDFTKRITEEWDLDVYEKRN